MGILVNKKDHISLPEESGSPDVQPSELRKLWNCVRGWCSVEYTSMDKSLLPGMVCISALLSQKKREEKLWCNA
jgi:hypothetical protein